MFPLVSIIIPCFNAQPVVAEAIESCLSQAYTAREVIVIDDGSTDASIDVLKSFGSHIRWETGPNRGGCSARNRGLQLARGEFVQFLDADDLLDANKLLKQVPLSLERTREIVYCDHYVLEEDSPTPVVRSRAMQWIDPLEFVVEHDALTTLAPLHRKQWLLEVGGFREGLNAAQEFDLHLRLAARGRGFYHLPQPLFTVRRRAMSVSSDPTKTFAQWLVFIPELIEDLSARGQLTVARRAVLATHIARSGRQVLRGGDKQAGLALLRLANELDRRSADRGAYGCAARWIKRCVGPRLLEKLVVTRRKIK